MAYTRKNIKNLTGGVSQQPDSERFDNQCSEQKNFLADPIKGLTKRAGTNYVQYIDDGEASLQHPAKNTFTHVINRSTSEQLMLCIGYDGSGADATPDISLFKLNEEDASLEKLDVRDADGNSLDASELNYLDVTNEQETHPYSAVTIADYTFIANKDITPALKATTSGGTGMYERDHVKRGIIFIKEGAYDSGYEIKATDSEGTLRSITIRTTNSAKGASGGASGNTGTMDARSDLIAGAIHYALEDTTEARTARVFSTTNASTYTDVTTNIQITYSDNNANQLFNGDGEGSDTAAEKLRSGSNYDHGHVTFVTQPNDNDKITITGCDASNTTRAFEFAGTTNTGSGGTNVGVTKGSTMLESMENLAEAINGETDTIAVKANVIFDETKSSYLVNVHSTREGTLTNASGGNMVRTTGADARFTVTALAGADASDQDDSTAPVRNKIHFQRLKVKDANETTGSIISWYASFASKEDADASSISIDVTDSYGNTMSKSYTDVLDDRDALPTTAPNNYVLKLEGNEETNVDDYYVKFVADDANATTNQFSKGEWKETLNIGLQYQIDPATMPHQLVKHSSTEYRFKPATWSDKSVGDASSDPAPQFIGNPIRDIFFYKSRLGVLAGESVVLSEVDNAFNFWRTSVVNLLDSDRIDITSSVNEITYLNWAIPFSNQLVIFSDRAQFLLTQGNQGLTPSTAALSLGSSYENSTLCRPVVNDNSIIFAQEKSGASAVYEMYPTGSTEISFEAKSISEHIPSYISGKITKISASSLASTVVVQTDTGDNTLYMYKYYNQGNQRVQSAWSKYELACNYIKGGHFISDKFHIIEGHHDDSSTVVSDCHWILTYMKFDNTDSLTNSVDLAFTVPTGSMAANTPTSGKTRITAEWDIADNGDDDEGREAKIIVFDSATNTTYEVDHTNTTNQYVVVTGNIASTATIVLGLTFEASYEFSKQYIKRGGRDGKEVAVTDGRTTTKWYEVYFNDTQYLKSTVSFPTVSDFKSSSVKEYTGSFSGGAVMGDQPSETSTLRTSVAARSDLPTITLSSDTHQTVTITGAAFELMHTSRLSRTN